ncbi:MAG: cardiolipin synthase [Prevotellaceae bacterium]|jgi:cardiolipin synthase|nr:cardiolipin synthase [Prevotellaceae bacterium]
MIIPVFDNIFSVLLVIYPLIASGIAVYIIYKHKDSVKTISWLILLFVLPLVGLILYFFFGQNYRKRKIFGRKALRDIKFIDNISSRQAGLLKRNKLFDSKSELNNYKNTIALLLNNSKSILTEYNSVTLYYDGESMISALKQALLDAKDSIHFQFYIIERGKVYNEIREILIQKAKEGVAVRIIYDDFGSWALKNKDIKTFTKNGIEIFAFGKVRFHQLTSKSNFRNHRKIVVIDGKVSFVGGMNIADRYVYGNEYFQWWRDTHMCIKGEAVNVLQLIFLVDWFFVSKQQIFIDHDRYFPKSVTDEKCNIQIAASGPDSDWASIMQTYFYAISSAKKHIYITSPYFMPNESVLTAIKVASLSGVDVRIILPGKSDSKVVYWATLAYVQDLLEAGVKVYLYNKRAFNHAKTLTIDGEFSSIGSVNMDNRSFEYNFEVTAIVYDKQIAMSLENQFRYDCSKSTQVRLRMWNNRSFWKNLSCSIARLFSPVL